MDIFRAVVAVILTVIFVVFGAFLVLNADTASAGEWERWIYVFGAAEAVAFTAIGWTFGREVNRQRAEKAEEKAEQAEVAARVERSKGAALAGLVRGAASGGRERLEQQGAAGSLDAAAEFAAEQYGV